MSDVEAKLDELAKEHDGLTVIRTKKGALAFRPPSGAEFQRFTDKLTKDKGSNYGAMKELAMCCLCYPDADSARPILDRYPALVMKACEFLQQEAGMEFEAEKKG